MARWATIEEVADYTKISAGTLKNKISKREGLGKLFYKVDGSRRADLDEIDAYLKGDK